MTELAGTADRAAEPVAPDEVLPAIAAAVLAVPGVTALSPTLSSAGLRSVIHRRATDGIQLVTRTGLVEVDVNVATAGTRSARAVAHEIRDRVGAELRSHGSIPGTIAVSVLTIGETPDQPPPG